MWVTRTWRRAIGSTPASRSFCTGLPPQSTSAAPSSATKTSDVVSRSDDGTAPDVPRKAKRLGIEERVGEVRVRPDRAHRDQHQELAVHEELLAVREGEAADERAVLRVRPVDQRDAGRQRLARHQTDDAVLGVEPDRRDVALTGLRADDGHHPPAGALGVAHVVTHAERAPFGEEIGGGALRGHEQVDAAPGPIERGHLVEPAVGPPHPDAVADRELDLALTLDGLLEALAQGQLE